MSEYRLLGHRNAAHIEAFVLGIHETSIKNTVTMTDKTKRKDTKPARKQWHEAPCMRREKLCGFPFVDIYIYMIIGIYK